MKLPDGKTRLDLIREGHGNAGLSLGKRGRLILNINKLREDPNNERKTFRNMEGLIASVKAVGLVEPITVTPEVDGDLYRIVTGHRRYRAAKAAGLSEVEVLIRDPEDELTRRRKSIVSNVQREDIGPVEMAEALQTMIDEDTTIKSQDDLAKAIGKDKAWVSGMLRVLTLSERLRHKVGLTQQSISYDPMIRIARLVDAKQQERLIDMLLEGATQSEIRNQIDQFKGKPAKPRNQGESNPKPKRVYHTDQDVTIIVQSETHRLTPERILLGLKQALRQAGRTA